MRATPYQRGTKGCHDNAGYLATGPRNLRFITPYCNSKTYELQNRQIYSALCCSHLKQIWGQMDKGQGHRIT